MKTDMQPFGANWRTALTGSSAGLMFLLHFLADLNYTYGNISTLFPPKVKEIVSMVSAAAGCILLTLAMVSAKDKQVTGGVIPNDVHDENPRTP